MKKLALIIGNQNYNNIDPLNNPINDANSIETVFKRLGIDTIKKTDITNIDFIDAIDDFISKLSYYEVAIFFFSGHGCQIDGENYLCPIDIDASTSGRITVTSFRLQYLLDKLSSSPVYTKIIILDACRNAPGRTLFPKGLGPISAPYGTFIAFSTSPGKTASDGIGNNGAYTEALLKHIETKDLPIEELFKRTRSTLYSMTSGDQVSWEHTSLMGDFCFSSNYLSGNFPTNYSINAIQDSLFNFQTGTEISEIIKLLHSHNWDNQNLGFYNLLRATFTNATIDELFVLGRNMYQTNCSTSWSANEYFNDLRNKLISLNEEIRFHILNGILFEIYFNNQGKLRDEFKLKSFTEVMALKNQSEFEESFLFIKSYLIPYDYRVIIIPKKDTQISIDIKCEEKTESVFVVSEIIIAGKNVLYNFEGSDYYKIDDPHYLSTKTSLKTIICNQIAGIESEIQFNFLGINDDIEEISIPYGFRLLNYRIRDVSASPVI